MLQMRHVCPTLNWCWFWAETSELNEALCYINSAHVIQQTARKKNPSFTDSWVCLHEWIWLGLRDYTQWNVKCLHHMTCCGCVRVCVSSTRFGDCESLTGRQTDGRRAGETAGRRENQYKMSFIIRQWQMTERQLFSWKNVVICGQIRTSLVRDHILQICSWSDWIDFSKNEAFLKQLTGNRL